MKLVIIDFIWKHIKKFLSAIFMAVCYGIWSFIQMPYQAAADIVELKEGFRLTHRELKELHIGQGINNSLLNRVESKIDTLQGSIYKTGAKVNNRR